MFLNTINTCDSLLSRDKKRKDEKKAMGDRPRKVQVD